MSGRRVVVAAEVGIAVRSAADVSGVIGATWGADGLILTESDLSPDFFDLRTGLAGELFQKLTNYGVKTALVLPDFQAHGQRFSELALEHSVHNQIRFVRTLEAARAWLLNE